MNQDPLPPLGGWAVGADLGAYLLRLCKRVEPRDVLEIGSGASTLIMASAMRANERGHVTAIDHDEFFAEQTRASLLMADLDEWATVVHAPLSEVEIGGERFRWYDLSGAELPEHIDVLLVDGPPGTTGSLARYPALPMLRERLGRDSVVLLDDYRRPDERRCVERWVAEFSLSARELGHRAGTAEIRFVT